MAVAGAALLVAVAADGGPSVAYVLLVLLALAAVGTVPLVALAPTAAPGVAYETLVLLGSIIGAVAALVAGRWVALAVVGLLGATCLIAMRDERRSGPGRLTDATGVPVDAAPEPERLPAPRA